jgi:hypothetical protein
LRTTSRQSQLLFVDVLRHLKIEFATGGGVDDLERLKSTRSLRAFRRPGLHQKTEKFVSWYENPIHLPGRWYLQVISQLFRENRLIKGEFVRLGKILSLGDVICLPNSCSSDVA